MLVRLVLVLVAVYVRPLVPPHGKALPALSTRRPPVVGLEQWQGLTRLPKNLDSRKNQPEPVVAVMVWPRMWLGKVMVYRPGILPLVLLGLLNFLSVEKLEDRLNHSLRLQERSQERYMTEEQPSLHLWKELHCELVVLGLLRVTVHLFALRVVPLVMDGTPLALAVGHEPLVFMASR